MDIVNTIMQKFTDETFQWLSLSILTGSIAIEVIPPIKLRPWSWLLKKFGTVMNQDICLKIENLDTKVNDLAGQVEELRELDKKTYSKMKMEKAISARRRIIKFAEELRIHKDHVFSNELFNDVLQDITDYEWYCEHHKEFKNEKASISIKYVRKSYEKYKEQELYGK